MGNEKKSIRFNKAEYLDSERICMLVMSDAGIVTHSFTPDQLLKALELLGKEARATFEYHPKRT
jgi:hypothetical protein